MIAAAILTGSFERLATRSLSSVRWGQYRMRGPEETPSNKWIASLHASYHQLLLHKGKTLGCRTFEATCYARSLPGYKMASLPTARCPISVGHFTYFTVQYKTEGHK